MVKKMEQVEGDRGHESNVVGDQLWWLVSSRVGALCAVYSNFDGLEVTRRM
jgi:hypothetical protein